MRHRSSLIAHRSSRIALSLVFVLPTAALAPACDRDREQPLRAGVTGDVGEAERTYGGNMMAQFDFSDTGPSFYTGVVERHTFRPPTGLSDPPLVPFMTAADAAFVTALPVGDPTVHAYTARIRVTHNDPDFGHDVHLAMLAGTLNTDADRAALRQTWLNDREALVTADLATASSLITAAGGTVLETGLLVPEVEFSANQAALASILATVQIEALVTPGNTDVTEELTENGSSLRLLTRVDEYADSPGHDVDGDGFPELFQGSTQRLAVIELWRNYHHNHPGLFGAAPTSGTAPVASVPRVVERASCDATGGNCNGYHLFIPGQYHPLMVASIAAGDLRAGQDPTITSVSARDAGTFQARRALLGEFALGSGFQRAWRNMFQVVARSSQSYDVANISLGNHQGNTAAACSGGHPVSRYAGDLFDSGVLPIAAAGNTFTLVGGTPSLTRCSLHVPADSLHAVAVAGSVDGARWMSTEDSNNGSSNGESSAWGLSGVDIMAPARYNWAYYKDRAKAAPEPGYTIQFFSPIGDVDNSIGPVAGEYCNNRDDDGDGATDEGFLDYNMNGTPDCAEAQEIAGTSLAAPAVAGAMLAYRQFFHKKYNRLIDDPGIAYVNLLLRGDRYGAPSGVSGFGDATGAGRLEMWMTQTPALTPSWGWGTGRVCVADGEQVTINMRTSMPADVKGLRAVAWWSDDWNRRDQVDLAVLRNGATIASDAASSDVKRRVNLQPSHIVGGAHYELRLTGDDIRGSDPTCGNREKLVRWGYLYADELGF